MTLKKDQRPHLTSKNTLKPIMSLEAEQAVLGAVLMMPDKLLEIIELIRPEDFYSVAHQKIFQGFLDLYEAEIAIDYVTISNKLRAQGDLERVGGSVFITGLAEQIGFAVNIKHYAQIIHDKSTLRRLSDTCKVIDGACFGEVENIQDFLNWTKNQIGEIIEGAGGTGKKGLSAMVRDWVETTDGLILNSNVHRDLDLNSRRLKKQANEVLRRMVEEGKLTPCGDRAGCYKKIEESPEIDWQNADIENIYQIAWPFELEKFVTLYPGNIVVLAGAPNVGKTGFLYNLIKLNQQAHKVVYFNSESGPEEMKVRLSKFENISLKDWRFLAKERSSNFAEAIFPNRLNIIDYIEITDNFYQIGGELKKIHDRFKRGVAVVALQKKIGAELGRGAEFALEKPRLYLSMDSGKLKIVKGKNWANPEINPNGMVFSFKLLQGAKFIEWE